MRRFVDLNLRHTRQGYVPPAAGLKSPSIPLQAGLSAKTTISEKIGILALYQPDSWSCQDDIISLATGAAIDANFGDGASVKTVSIRS